MEKYSVSETSRILEISKDTLRYYDKIGLVCPQRGENQYRFYEKGDFYDLQYIEVMKYAGFSLKEIKKILGNKRGCTGENLADTMCLVEDKQKEIIKKIELYQYVLQLISEVKTLLKNKNLSEEPKEINDLMENIFNKMKGKNGSE